jgi:hypothetical protein
VVLASDLFQRVADDVEEVLVGVEDRAIGCELDDGLVAAKGGDLVGVTDILQALRGIGPFHHKSDPALALHERCDQQIKRQLADPDGRAVLRAQGREHVPLVRKALVEDLNVAPDQGRHAKARKLRPQIGFGFLQQFAHGRIKIGNVEIDVGEHDVGANGFEGQ